MTVDASIASLTCEVYTVPTDRPEADGTLSWDKTVLVLVRARAGVEEGIGWTYATPAVKTVVDDVLADIVLHGDATAVTGHHEAMTRAVRNLGRPGIASCAISAVDIALWDLKAKCLGRSLTELWGAVHLAAPIYGSGGFTTYDDAATADQLLGWVGSDRIPRVKIKIGEAWGHRVDRDLARVALARQVVGEDVELYVDANGGYSAKQAIRMGRRFHEEFGVTWFEEPVTSDDLAGLRAVREAVAPDVTAGEYGYTPWYFAQMIDAEAVDCVQVDVTRCGGFSDWLTIAGMAASHHLEVSAHCAPNLHAHVGACVTNLRHIEYFHDHVRIEQALFEGVLSPRNGTLSPSPDRKGHGMTLRDVDAEPYRTA